MKLFRNNKPLFSGLAATAGTTSMTITGKVQWFKGNVLGNYTSGVAYKLTSASSYTHKAVSGEDINTTIAGLTGGSEYTVALYWKIGGEYIYSDTVTCTPEAAEA